MEGEGVEKNSISERYYELLSLPNINARIVIHCEEKDNKVLLCAIRYPAAVATPLHHADRDTNYGVDVARQGIIQT